MSALAAACLPLDDASTVMRYTNGVMHIYYLLISGPMDNARWNLLQDRGLLTSDEVDALKRHGSPGVVLHSWALDVALGANLGPATEGNNAKSFFLGSMEECIGGVRGLAAKQIAYSKNQVPFIYFSVVWMATQVSLLSRPFTLHRTTPR